MSIVNPILNIILVLLFGLIVSVGSSATRAAGRRLAEVIPVTTGRICQSKRVGTLPAFESGNPTNRELGPVL